MSNEVKSVYNNKHEQNARASGDYSYIVLFFRMRG